MKPIDELSDRELDAAVAEEVFNLKVKTADDYMWPICMLGNCSDHDGVEAKEKYIWQIEEGHQPEKRIPPYSSSVAAAWRVVEQLRPTLWMTLLTPFDGKDKYHVSFAPIGQPSWSHRVASAVAETAPLAICRAALAALRATREQKGD